MFARANGMKLGDVANSMTNFNGKLWIVMNGSNVVFAINPDTFKELGRVEGVNSPRYIHFVSKDKAYVSQYYDNTIAVINPATYSVTGHITVPDMEDAATASTGQMVQIGRYVYCTCPSYQKKIVKIDTNTDKVVAELEVGIQPTNIVVDRKNNIWCLTDGGGWAQNPVGYEAPAVCKINPETFKVETRYTFTLGDYVHGMAIDNTKENLYWINGDLWKMNISDSQLPSAPFISSDANFYGMTVNPANGEVYLSDAVDYQQNGKVYRYSSEGAKLDEFNVGIIPGSFCRK